jgi:hypothetical protein
MAGGEGATAGVAVNDRHGPSMGVTNVVEGQLSTR